MSATQPAANLVMPVTEGRDHIQGSVGAAATLVQYGDYGCAFCSAAHAMIKEVQAQMGERLRFVYRHFPIRTLNPHAQQAAEAAEAAAAQGKFWHMHELLSENQPRLSDQDLRAYAQMLELNIELFANELAEHLHAARVREDFMSGIRSGVNGTPTFYINGVRHDDSYEVHTLLAAVERAAASDRGRE
jgi:protein-disulfide isomerase